MIGHASAGVLRKLCAFAAVGILAIVLCGVRTATADTSGAPLITIPPAKVTPPPTARPPDDFGAPIIEATPRTLLPIRVQILHDSQSAGIAMYGVLNGSAASATGVVLAIFANSGAFDSTPSTQLMLADKTDRHAQALFTAAVHGAAVVGIAVASLSDTGGDVTVLCDDAESFVASFPRMQQALAQSGAGTAILSPIRLGDGKEIGLPAGWRAVAEGVGSVDLRGPEGEFISLGETMPVYAGDPRQNSSLPQGPCCDPQKAFETLFPQIAAARQAAGASPLRLTNVIESQAEKLPNGGSRAWLLSSFQRGDDAYTGLALVEAVAGLADPWTLRLSSVMAPSPVFAASLPMLLQIWKSYRGSQPVFGDSLWRPLQDMSATQQMLKSTIAVRETAEYNADAGWQPVIAAMAKGAPGQSDTGLAQSLVAKLSADTGRPWRIVPAMEYE